MRSGPFKSARQKIYGLGHHLLVFVYEKKDDSKNSAATLNILYTVFVEDRRTADFTMTKLIRQHIEAGGNTEDLIGLMHDKALPVDDIEANNIARELLTKATMKTKEIAEFGDFQTPDNLAREVCAVLAMSGVRPAAILEPTCGVGSFLFASLDAFKGIKNAIGSDINTKYVKRAKATLRRRHDAKKANVVEADFFATDWVQVIAGLPEPILVIGNPPWVTNTQLGTLGSQNLPTKSNFQNRNGLDAITGKANFDISEWMLIRLLEAMNGRQGTLAMLCKASVARKALCFGWKNGILLDGSAIYRIDANLHFGAAVEAALLVTHFRSTRTARAMQANVYPQLGGEDTPTVIGYEDEMLFADLTAYHKWKHLCGEEHLKWRSGIKHDCSKLMELRRQGNRYRNGLAELVELEEAYLYPMLKSSDVANGCAHDEVRWMLVPQKSVGQDTAGIKKDAPKTWAYLNTHAALLNKRGSSIYRNRPAFSIFGIGDYSFAPWKVVISGFYKKLSFITVGPMNGRPVVLDDTSYFLPCQSKEQADYVTGLLNSPPAQAFYRACVFWDAKRPITADLLRRLDLRRVAQSFGSEQTFDALFGDPPNGSPRRHVNNRKSRTKVETTLKLWPHV